MRAAPPPAPGRWHAATTPGPAPTSIRTSLRDSCPLLRREGEGPLHERTPGDPRRGTDTRASLVGPAAELPPWPRPRVDARFTPGRDSCRREHPRLCAGEQDSHYAFRRILGIHLRYAVSSNRRGRAYNSRTAAAGRVARFPCPKRDAAA